jgi:trimethylamine--corrinoid protein Co-methyltransferase
LIIEASALNGFSKVGLKGSYLQPLSADELYRLHLSSLEILEKRGVTVYEPEALNAFEKAGCEVQANKIVKIPQYLVKESINKAPSSVTLCGRDRRHDFTVGDGHFNGGICGTAPHVLDLETHHHRKARKSDAADLARLLDALENLRCMFSPQVVPNDVPEQDIDTHAADAILRNTEKHVGPIVCFSDAHIEDVIEMAEAIAGGSDELRKRPIISALAEPVSPLEHSVPQTKSLIAYSRRGLPVHLTNHPITGFTSPVTLAATITQSNAEVLSYLVLAQLINPRTPTIFGPYGTTPNMKEGIHLPASVEATLIQTALMQMARYYRLPSLGFSGVNGKVVDAQMGIEDMLCVLPLVLAGADLVLMGLMDNDDTMAYEMLVIENEMVRLIGRFIKGVEVDDDRIALDLINRSRPATDFLSEKHTLTFYSSEHLIPRLCERSSRSNWEKAGSKDLLQRASEEAKRILRTHHPAPLGNQVSEHLDEIVKRSRKTK